MGQKWWEDRGVCERGQGSVWERAGECVRECRGVCARAGDHSRRLLWNKLTKDSDWSRSDRKNLQINHTFKSDSRCLFDTTLFIQWGHVVCSKSIGGYFYSKNSDLCQVVQYCIFFCFFCFLFLTISKPQLQLQLFLTNQVKLIFKRNTLVYSWASLCMRKVVVWAASWQNQQNDCAPSEDSDQPGHPPSLIKVFALCLMGS